MAMSGGTAQLVKTGYANGDTSYPIRLYVYYKTTQDNAQNKSTVTCGMYVTSPATWYDIGPWGDYRGSYVGTTALTFDGSIPNFAGTRWLVEDQSFTVSHNADGSGTAAIYWKWGVNSPWGGMEVPSGSFSISLPKIPRASVITSVSGATLGSSTTVRWTPASSSFHYKVKLSVGSWSWTSSVISPNRTSAYSYTTPAISLDAAKQFRSSKTGTMTATLYTYSNSAGTAQIGSADSETFTVTVPNNASTQPTATMTLSAVGELPAAFDGLYIQGRTSVRAAFTASSTYSTISTYQISGKGIAATGNPATARTNEPGTITITGRVTDTRGYYTEKTQDITVIPYTDPVLAPYTGESAVVCARCDSSGSLSASGIYLKIKAKRLYAKVEAGGTQKNFCTLEYRCKAAAAPDYPGTWQTLLAGSGTDTDLVDAVLPDVVPSAQTSYHVQVRARDDIGTPHTREFKIPTDFVTLHLKNGGKGVGMGKYAEADNTLELNEGWVLKIGSTTLSEEQLSALLALL